MTDIPAPPIFTEPSMIGLINSLVFHELIRFSKYLQFTWIFFNFKCVSIAIRRKLNWIPWKVSSFQLFLLFFLLNTNNNIISLFEVLNIEVKNIFFNAKLKQITFLSEKITIKLLKLILWLRFACASIL